MLVNYFRGSQQARSQLPTKQQLKIAVPTAYLAATEPEGAQHSERNTTDRKPHRMHLCLIACPAVRNLAT